VLFLTYGVKLINEAFGSITFILLVFSRANTPATQVRSGKPAAKANIYLVVRYLSKSLPQNDEIRELIAVSVK